MRVKCRVAATRIFMGLLFIAAYASTQAAAQEGDPAVGRIISIVPSNPPGKLKVKQRRGEQPAAATVGMPVRRGYMLTLDKDARAAVYCADGKKYDLMPGPQGCPCVGAARSVIYQGSVIPKGRGDDTANGNFPILLSPRMHMLLTTLPTIRWSPVAATPGARFKYRVSMYTETGELVWRMDNVTGTEMAYPAKAEALVRGETYKVVVQSGMESSEQERNVDSAFTVLAEDGVKNIRDGEEAIRKLNLPVDKTQLLIAEFYATRRLSSEAVEKLNAVAGTLREPAVLLMLGEIYASQGLFSEALKQYEDALALPQISSDTEGQALTLHAAGLSLERLGKHEAADSRFRSAVEAYRKLGDKVMVEQLRTGAKK